MPQNGFEPAFGHPCVFNPMESGMAVEDIWPVLYIGADRVSEIKRKIDALGWARAAFERWQAEAETVLAEPPTFTRKPGGGRGSNSGRCNMFTDQGHYRLFDPHNRDSLWDPDAKQWGPGGEKTDGAWMVLQHERLRRLISSLAFLWRLTGDERFSRWAWDGLRDLAGLYEETAAVHDVEAEPYRFVYGGLYEAQCQLLVIQALELLEGAPGGSAADGERVRQNIVAPASEAISRWMDVMMVHNMSVWSMAALAEAGRALGREDWIEKAFFRPPNGLVTLLEKGLPRHAETNEPDGFWFEHSPFYGCFYVVTAITPLVRAGEKAGVMTDDLRQRYASFFDAMPHLADAQLRLLSISDRVAPGTMRLTQARHLYEYAAGQVDAKHAPLLAHLYEECGAPRHSLAALAFGPDELPAPEAPKTLVQSCVLPEAGLATFRRQTPKGDATMWFSNLKHYPRGAQGHHHMDKLSLSLHAFGAVVTSDLGWPGLESVESCRPAYLSGTLSHNTLMLNEFDQGAVETLSFATDLEATVPWARGSFRGDSSNRMQKTFRDHHHGRVQDGLYDDAVITRTVWFDFPRIVILDELAAESEKRFGFVFHARGQMVATPVPDPQAEALAMPALPEDGAWRLFTGRAAADPLACFIADWRVRADIYLRATVVGDGPFDAHWGATPDNPGEILRGSIYLRAPGRTQRFATALELHRGTPGTASVELAADGTVRLHQYDGAAKTYATDG